LQRILYLHSVGAPILLSCTACSKHMLSMR
jgi:hypothetical protein